MADVCRNYHLAIMWKLPAVAEIVGVPQNTISVIVDNIRKRQLSIFDKDFKPFIKKAEWLDTFYPHGADRGNQYTGGKVTKGNLAKMPVTKKESATKKPSG